MRPPFVLHNLFLYKQFSLTDCVLEKKSCFSLAFQNNVEFTQIF